MYTDGVVASGCVFACWRLALLRRVGASSTSSSTSSDVDVVGNSSYYKELLMKFCCDPKNCDRLSVACAQAIICCDCFKAGYDKSSTSLALIHAIEYLLNVALNKRISHRLRQSIIEICLDACTGKAPVLNRVGSLSSSGESFGVFPLDGKDVCNYLNGPLGGTFGGDNSNGGLPIKAGREENPAAFFVNEGVKRGLSILKKKKIEHKV